MASLIGTALSDLAAERDELWQRINDIRRLHMRVVRRDDTICAECRTEWPCATRKTLDR